MKIITAIDYRKLNVKILKIAPSLFLKDLYAPLAWHTNLMNDLLYVLAETYLCISSMYYSTLYEATNVN